MLKEAYLEFCASILGASIDQPFARNNSSFIADTIIARHADTNKWFAAIMERDSRVFVNLKTAPFDGDFLRGVYAGITPAYHMNKWHWISVYLQSDVPDELIQQLTIESFSLTERGSRKKRTR